MSTPSSIDKLPQAIREKIGHLRMEGCTLDQILAQLTAMEPARLPSRSALGRHVMKMDALGEKMRRSRAVAEGLAKELGAAPESQAARLNIELLHSAVMDLFMASAEGELDEVDESGKAALAGNPEGVMMLAKALESLTRASKVNNDFVAAAEKRAAERTKREAAEAVDTVGKQRGIASETLAAIKRGIFGVDQAGPAQPSSP